MRQPCEMTRCDVMWPASPQGSSFLVLTGIYPSHCMALSLRSTPPWICCYCCSASARRSARLPAELDLGRVGRIIPPCTRLFHACTVITGHVKYYQTLLCILRVPRYLECIWGNLPMDCLAEYYRSTLARLAMCWALRIMYCMCNVVFIGQGL